MYWYQNKKLLAVTIYKSLMQLIYNISFTLGYKDSNGKILCFVF